MSMLNKLGTIEQKNKWFFFFFNNFNIAQVWLGFFIIK